MFDMVNSSSTEVIVTYYNLNKVQCVPCNGTGFQQDNSGIYRVCPICEGSGWREIKQKSEPAPCEPCYPCYPWYPMPWQDQPTYVPERQKYIITC